jgi:hypothetical protein
LFGELQLQKNNNVEAVKYKNKKYVLKKIAQLIKTNPLYIASTLKYSKVFIENPYNKRELAEKVAHSLVNNLSFQKNIALVLGVAEAGKLDVLTDGDFSSLGGRGEVDQKGEWKNTGKVIGSATVAGTAQGGWVGAIVGAVVGAVNAGFSWGTAGKRAKIDEEQYRQELLGELFEEPKKNYLPLYIIGGVLLAGGVVTYFALKE